MDGWFGFFFFMAVCVYCDHQQYLAGHDSYFFEHKTDEEKRIRNAQIAILEKEASK